MSSAVAHRMYLALFDCCSGMPAERMSFSKNLIGVGDLLHQARERGAQQRDAQAAEQQQQRAGGAHDRIGVRRDQIVDPEAWAPAARLGRGTVRRRWCGVEIHSSAAASRGPARIAAEPAGTARGGGGGARRIADRQMATVAAPDNRRRGFG